MRIGTRGTTMALAQTKEAIRQLRLAWPDEEFEAAVYKPLGDRDQVSKLERHGGKGGAFVAEIRAAMRDGRIEAAMHSLKDMPGDEETPGLVIAATLKREAFRDALVLRADIALSRFLDTRAEGLKIGTNSVRRAAYLRRLYPGAEIIHFRGAADTRIRKLDEGVPQKLPNGAETPPADALVVARAGLDRIGAADRAAYEFSIEEMLPAIGQGIVAIECPARAFDARKRLAVIDDQRARAAAAAEREILWILNGHCNSPIAGHASCDGDRMFLRAAVLAEDGSKIVEADAAGPAARPRELGREVAISLLEKGAKALIEKSRIAD